MPNPTDHAFASSHSFESRRHRVILDTDIGTDPDDALALAVLLGSDDVDLVGVCTSYGDTELRARIARRMIRLSGRDADGIACVPGARRPLSGRDVWWAGHEGNLLTHLESESVDDERPAHEWLIEQVAQAPGELEILAVAPLTNIALALRADPSFAGKVRRLWVMGGDYDSSATEAEHNFASDAVAASEVIASGMRMTLCGLEVTRQVRLEEADVAGLAGYGELGSALAAHIRQWMAYWGEDFDVPHDATTAQTMLRPDLFTTMPVSLLVDPVTGACKSVSGGDPFVDAQPSAQLVTSVQRVPSVWDLLDRVAQASSPAR